MLATRARNLSDVLERRVGLKQPVVSAFKASRQTKLKRQGDGNEDWTIPGLEVRLAVVTFTYGSRYDGQPLRALHFIFISYYYYYFIYLTTIKTFTESISTYRVIIVYTIKRVMAPTRTAMDGNSSYHIYYVQIYKFKRS